MPSTVGHVGEKDFIDLVSFFETVRKNRHLLTAQDEFTKFASAYPICSKEASTATRVLIREHFSGFGLPNQMHSDKGGEFINQLWKELFQELKRLHTKTPPYNPSSNSVERWHRTIVRILRAMGSEMQDEWDLNVKSTCLTYNTTMHTSTGWTPYFAMFEREATLPVNFIYPVPKAGVLRLDWSDAGKVPEGLCWYERETASHSGLECLIIQTNCVPVWGWTMGPGLFLKIYLDVVTR